MTAREKQAVKMVRKSGLVKYKQRDVRFMSDEELLQSGACQGYIEMADWQAEQCAYYTMDDKMLTNDVLNAGKEEV